MNGNHKTNFDFEYFNIQMSSIGLPLTIPPYLYLLKFNVKKCNLFEKNNENTIPN